MTSEGPARDDAHLSGGPAAGLLSRGWSRLGAGVCLLEGVVLLAFAVFYLVELSRGEGDTATVVLSAAVILVMGALLVLLARFWLVGSPRASTPTIVWNLVLLPVVYALYSSGAPLVASGVLVVAVVALVAGVGAAASVRET